MLLQLASVNSDQSQMNKAWVGILLKFVW